MFVLLLLSALAVFCSYTVVTLFIASYHCHGTHIKNLSASMPCIYSYILMTKRHSHLAIACTKLQLAQRILAIRPFVNQYTRNCDHGRQHEQ
jgi:uncharacterized membrane protein YozB (DUF420 family)